MLIRSVVLRSPERPDDLKAPGELGLSDEFRPADDFAAPDEPGPFGVTHAPYGVPYAGSAPYGVPYPGEPYDPEGPYGRPGPRPGGRARPAGGYSAPDGRGAPGDAGRETAMVSSRGWRPTGWRATGYDAADGYDATGPPCRGRVGEHPWC